MNQRKAEIARDGINLEKGAYEGKDVISLCLRANMVADQRDRLTDKEMRGQIGALVSLFHGVLGVLTHRCSLATRPPPRL